MGRAKLLLSRISVRGWRKTNVDAITKNHLVKPFGLR